MIKLIEEDRVGVVTGMAWTGYGGDTLPVEVSAMDGTGKLRTYRSTWRCYERIC